MANVVCCKNNVRSEQDISEIAEFLKIINEPNRLKILCLLRHGEQCVCDISNNLDLPQNLTSHHLKMLKDFRLIQSTQQGRSVLYKSNKKTIKKYTSLLSNFLTSNL